MRIVKLGGSLLRDPLLAVDPPTSIDDAAARDGTSPDSASISRSSVISRP
mgnify:CR=1 FL=1